MVARAPSVFSVHRLRVCEHGRHELSYQLLTPHTFMSLPFLRSDGGSHLFPGTRTSVSAGQAGLKSRATEAVDDDHRRLQATIGELLMETELLYAKVDQLEAGRPLARRRSTQ